jgi:hypothetical protein
LAILVKGVAFIWSPYVGKKRRFQGDGNSHAISSMTVYFGQATWFVGLLENVEKMAGTVDDCLHRRAFGAHQGDL